MVQGEMFVMLKARMVKGWERARAPANHRKLATGKADGVKMLFFRSDCCNKNEFSRSRQKTFVGRMAPRNSEKQTFPCLKNHCTRWLAGWLGLVGEAGWLGFGLAFGLGLGRGWSCWAVRTLGCDYDNDNYDHDDDEYDDDDDYYLYQ